MWRQRELQKAEGRRKEMIFSILLAFGRFSHGCRAYLFYQRFAFHLRCRCTDFPILIIFSRIVILRVAVVEKN